MQTQPDIGENPIKLILRIVVALGIRSAIVEIFHRVRAKQIMHQLILYIQCQRLVEMLIPNNILPHGSWILFQFLLEFLPIIARIWI